MNVDEKECRELLSRNVKRYRNRLGLSQLNLALELGISATFLSDIETGKKWVSAQTLAQIAKALKIEIYELFEPERGVSNDVSEAIVKYLDDVDDAFIQSIGKAASSAAQKFIKKMRRYYSKESKSHK